MNKVDFNDVELERLRKCRNEKGIEFSDTSLFKWAKEWETICNKLNFRRRVGMGTC